MYMLCYIQTMFHVSKHFLLQFQNNFLGAIKLAQSWICYCQVSPIETDLYGIRNILQ
jgi:hypothetical protein